MQEDGLSDEQLLDQYFLGEAAAFKTFFVRHRGRVFAYAKRKGLEPELAREASQDAFLRLHRSIHHYETGRPALAWFFSIVHNCVVDTMRKAKTASAAPWLESLGSEAYGADDLSDELQGVMNQLTPEQRQLMQLRAVEELSFKEISQRMGKSDATLRKLFERSRRALKASLLGRNEIP